MTEEIKKMLNPRLWATMADEEISLITVSREDFLAVKRGFEKLIEQREYWARMSGSDWSNDQRAERENDELEKIMKGEG